MTLLQKQIEDFLLSKIQGVMLPISVIRVAELLHQWELQKESEVYVPNEYRCPQCNFRSGTVQACQVDGSSMERVSWKDAALTAGRIASRARERVSALENSWPADRGMPAGSLDDPSLEDKIDSLRDKGLYDILFRNAGVGLMFFNPPDGFTYPEWTPGMNPAQREERERSWRKYLVVDDYYDSFQEAVSAEWLKRNK